MTYTYLFLPTFECYTGSALRFSISQLIELKSKKQGAVNDAKDRDNKRCNNTIFLVRETGGRGGGGGDYITLSRPI